MMTSGPPGGRGPGGGAVTRVTVCFCFEAEVSLDWLDWLD
jgi:hypothetical protein